MPPFVRGKGLRWKVQTGSQLTRKHVTKRSTPSVVCGSTHAYLEPEFHAPPGHPATRPPSNWCLCHSPEKGTTKKTPSHASLKPSDSKLGPTPQGVNKIRTSHTHERSFSHLMGAFDPEKKKKKKKKKKTCPVLEH